jgi:hypothetical protein
MSHRKGRTFQQPKASAALTMTTLAMHCARISKLGQLKLKLLRACLFNKIMAADTLQYANPANSGEGVVLEVLEDASFLLSDAVCKVSLVTGRKAPDILACFGTKANQSAISREIHSGI